MMSNLCELCRKRIKDVNDVYSVKLYKGWIEALKTEYICFDCYSDIKKFISKKRK